MALISSVECFAMRLSRFTVSAQLVYLAGSIILVLLLGTFGRSAGGNSQVEVPNAAPWERQYKIKPDEKAWLTAADVVGPDGRMKTLSSSS